MVRVKISGADKAVAFPKGDSISVDDNGNLHIFQGKERIAIAAPGYWEAAEVGNASPSTIRVLPAPEGSNE